jgi:DNA-binding HxlR family transcriptional regulator
MNRTLKGIEETLQRIIQRQEVSLDDLKKDLQSFRLLSQKWNLEILYTLFLRKTANFSEIKKTLRINSRTLSDKLKSLRKYGYVERTVKTEPPLRVEYALTTRGKNTVLLALPLLYYSSNSTAL